MDRGEGVFGLTRDIVDHGTFLIKAMGRSQSPLMQLMKSSTTWVAMIATASPHPQRRRRNHPIPAVVRAAPSNRQRIPTAPRRGASCLYAVGLRVQRRSRAVPRQSSCSETRHNRTKEQENAYCSESRRLRPESESRLGRFVAPHLLNISATHDRIVGSRFLQILYATSDSMEEVATSRRNHDQRRDDGSLRGGIVFFVICIFGFLGDVKRRRNKESQVPQRRISRQQRMNRASATGRSHL